MILRKKKSTLSFFITTFVIMMSSITAYTATVVGNLMVEYQKEPIGIDVQLPRFSWQLVSTDAERGIEQSAYQIIVKDPAGNVMWDTKKIADDISVGIEYAGSALQASTRYDWTVKVWDQEGKTVSGSTWFETGLMDDDPALSAWEGADWIGGGDEDLVLYSHYLSIFNLEYTMAIEEGSERAGFILGANDIRLMDKDKNIFQVESAINESYIKLEMDLAGLKSGTEGKAKLNVYRVGYTDKDIKDKPFQSFDIQTSVINNENKYSEHTITISAEFGQYTLSIDGNTSFNVQMGSEVRPGPGGPGGFGGPPAGGMEGGAPGGPGGEGAGGPPQGEAPQGGMQGGGPGRPGGRGVSINVNPMGSGGNYITFGFLCDIGFAVEPGQKASFSDVTVLNNRLPNNVLFKENLNQSDYQGIYAAYLDEGLVIEDGKYKIDGGNAGIMIVEDPSKNSTPMLRTKFDVASGKVSDARLYVTARGIYEMYLNGKRIGDGYYAPGLTQYNKTHLYQTYDVTDMIQQGENAMGAMLGEGWWSGLLSFGSIWNHFGDRQSLLAKLVITYQDGSREVVVTDDTWKYCNQGPVLYSSLDMGEVYDATRESEIEGWANIGFDDSDWGPAKQIALEGTAYISISTERDGTVTHFNFEDMQLLGQIGNQAGVFTVLTAKSMEEVRPGVYVYNMGQNLVGVPKITIKNGKAGDKMVLRFAEMLYPDLDESGNNVGMIMTENYRAALSQDIYYVKEGDQVFQPRFTSHGFQYIEITGIDEPLPLEAVQSVAISSVRSLTADYNTSNERVNQLWSNLVWSNIDNFLTIPTDCPQRNERMGWSGDISVFSRTATYLSNSNQFLTRHMRAMRDVQVTSGKFTDVAPVGGGFGGILWGSAGIVVPWEVYLQYGDVGLLEEHYDAMADYMAYLQTTINEKTGLSSDAQLGDWLGPQNNKLGSAYLATAYHVYDLDIMIKIAEILGKEADADNYRKLHSKRKAFFNKTFVNEDHKTLGVGGGGFGFGGPRNAQAEFRIADTQTSYAVGLALGAFSEENIPYMSENLAATVIRKNEDDDGVMRPEYSLMTGFIGTSWISKSLSNCGYSDLAYKLLQNDQYPSWLYAIDQGATSIWERLNGYTVENGFGGNNSMNSFNHYSFGAVGQWMLAYSLGIQRDEPGFKSFILQPEPDPTGEMTSAEGYYDSMYGRISSSWKVENGKLTYAATVPANTTATLYIPAVSEDVVKEGGKSAAKASGISFLKFENGKAVYQLKSGSYEFTSDI